MRFRHHQAESRSASRRLIALFALAVAGLVVAVNAGLGFAWLLLTGQLGAWLGNHEPVGWPQWFFEVNTAVTLAFVFGGMALELSRLAGGGQVLAEQVGGRRLTPGTIDAGERRLLNVVDEMALAAHIRPPAVYLLDRDDGVNAFAAGWTISDAVIGVTRGAMQRLERAELQGVVAHEIAHILEGDMRLNLRLVGMVWGIELVYRLGLSMLRAATLADDRGQRSLPPWFVVPAVMLMIVGATGLLAGRILRAAVSRHREYLADASAVQFTRLPDGLGSALRRIAWLESREARPLARPEDLAIAHLLLASPGRNGLGAWFASHPPVRERIRRLYGRTMPPLPLPAPLPEVIGRVASDGAALAPIEYAAPDAATPAIATPAAVESAAADPLAALPQALAEDPAALALAIVASAGAAAGAAGAGLASTSVLDRLPRALHLHAFERALTELRHRPHAVAPFLAQARALAARDRRLSPREWALLALAQSRLGRAPAQEGFVAPRAIAASLRTVTRFWVAAVVRAQAGLADAATLERIALAELFDAQPGTRHDTRPETPGASPATSRPQAPTLAEFTAALADVARLYPLRKPILVKGWLAAAARLDEDLIDLLAGLCAAIDTPSPAIADIGAIGTADDGRERSPSAAAGSLECTDGRSPLVPG